MYTLCKIAVTFSIKLLPNHERKYYAANPTILCLKSETTPPDLYCHINFLIESGATCYKNTLQNKGVSGKSTIFVFRKCSLMEGWKEYKYTGTASLIGGRISKTTEAKYWNGNILP